MLIIFNNTMINITFKLFIIKVIRILKSKIFSKKTKARLHTAIIRFTLTYGYEAWTTTSNTEKRLRTFENKIWRTICGSIFDYRTCARKRKCNGNYRMIWDWHQSVAS